MKKTLLSFLILLPALAWAQTYSTADISDNPPSAYANVNPTSLTLTPNVTGSRGTSSSAVFNWFQWLATADTVAAPTGFLVSVDNSTFVSSLIISTTVTQGSIPVYVALKSTNSVGSYSGNVTFTAGPVVVNLPVSGTTNGVASMSVSPTSLNLTDTVGSPGSPGTLTVTFAYLSGSVNVTVPTATVPLELSLDKITWASSLSFNSGSPVPVYARITSSASQASATDTIAFSNSSVSTVKIPINAVVSNPSSVHYRTITIPTSSVTGSLTNFPMVFNETQTFLKTTANGGEVQNANGYDITFSTDAAGTQLLNWEVETYNGSTGQLVAWVKIPSLSTSSATTIYMRYNQPSITTFQGGSAGSVWDANYKGVWHMNQVITSTGQSITDYTSNGNNMTSAGTWTSAQSVAAKVGNGINSLKASGDYFTIFPPGTPGFNGDFTFEGWFYITTLDNTTTPFGATTFGNTTNFYSDFYRLYNGSDDIVDGTATPASTWTHLVITRTGTNGGTQAGTLTIYHNGVASAGPSTGANFTYNMNNLNYSQATGASSNIQDDEVRFSTVGRSGVWVAAEYLDMNAPDTFYQLGTEH